MPKPHQKHAHLVRPSYGYYGRLEWAILGTACHEIQALARTVIASLGQQWRLAYVDADRAAADHAIQDPYLNEGAALAFTDKINFHEYHRTAVLNPYQNRLWFNDQDLVLVNGNHFLANQQIVVVDSNKEASLQRKLDRLTNISLVILKNPDQPIFPFLQDLLDQQTLKPPLLEWENQPAILDWMKRQLSEAIAPLNGLVLAGGKSTRMGTDKASLTYHQKPQKWHVADMLKPFCRETLISYRHDHVLETDSAFQPLPDAFIGLGPFGAIATAFKEAPNHSWLIVACDLPLLTEKSLHQLVAARNPAKYATAFKSPFNDFPEPLITIWEPRSYPTLMQFLTQGYSCPRKVLMNSDIQLVVPEFPEELTNVNHPHERAEVFKKLKA